MPCRKDTHHRIERDERRHRRSHEGNRRYGEGEQRNGLFEGLLDLSDGLQRSHFDQTATLELLSCFLRTGRVIRILYDSALTNIVNAPGDTTLLDFPDHTDHFHVRIADPDGPNN